MAVIHGKAKRKSTGGRFTNFHTKRLHQKGSLPAHTKIAAVRKKTVTTKGGGYKVKLFASDILNLYDPRAKKYSLAKIQTASENSADRHFVRHNILTKGAVVVTDKGKARITNRPGQEGIVNAVLVE